MALGCLSQSEAAHVNNTSPWQRGQRTATKVYEWKGNNATNESQWEWSKIAIGHLTTLTYDLLSLL